MDETYPRLVHGVPSKKKKLMYFYSYYYWPIGGSKITD